VEGDPPLERRFWSAFPCDASHGAEPLWSQRVASSVVGVDSADVEPGWPGQELLETSAVGVRLRASDGSSRERLVRVPGGLLLPGRTRQVSRWAVSEPWNGMGPPAAVLPSARGAWILPLDGSTPREIELPVVSDYRTPRHDPPVDEPELLRAELTWPQLATGDDDGNGHLDLFAMWRFGTLVFRGRPDAGGIASKPTRRMLFKPFPKEEEYRHAATGVRMFVRDVDGDGRSDLIVDRTMGGLLSSHASTAVHLNRGDGARLDRAPDATIAIEGAIAAVDVIDLDGDGRVELVRRVLRFSAVQMLRFVVTGRARVDFEVLRFAASNAGEEASAAHELRASWEESISLDIDFSKGRIAGFFPDVRGDWNGDGLRDLIYPDGKRRMAIRLGTSSDAGPGFGPRVARQALPIEAGTLALADFDGDGLDDLVVYDPRDDSGRVYLLINRGALRGTMRPPELRPRRENAAASSPIP
jgi:hypothetical protein